jgi:hypothetical protein
MLSEQRINSLRCRKIRQLKKYISEENRKPRLNGIVSVMADVTINAVVLGKFRTEIQLLDKILGTKTNFDSIINQSN